MLASELFAAAISTPTSVAVSTMLEPALRPLRVKSGTLVPLATKETSPPALDTLYKGAAIETPTSLGVNVMLVPALKPFRAKLGAVPFATKETSPPALATFETADNAEIST